MQSCHYATQHGEDTFVSVRALYLSRPKHYGLDYCSSLQAYQPMPSILCKSATHLGFNHPMHSHTTPLLRSLHWHPVAARIRHKTMTLTFAATKKIGPAFLQDVIQLHATTHSRFSATLVCLLTPARCTKAKVLRGNSPYDLTA